MEVEGKARLLLFHTLGFGVLFSSDQTVVLPAALRGLLESQHKCKVGLQRSLGSRDMFGGNNLNEVSRVMRISRALNLGTDVRRLWTEETEKGMKHYTGGEPRG